MTLSSLIRLTALLVFLTSLSSPAGAETREVLLAAYSVPKEVYEKRILPAFVQHWKERTGETIQVRSSFAASGAQARAIVGGLDADIAALSLESDLQQLIQAGLVTHDWKQGPQQGIITTSLVALGVRKGNPKSIHGWEDLTRPGVEVLYPSPKTSGGAMWISWLSTERDFSSVPGKDSRSLRLATMPLTSSTESNGTSRSWTKAAGNR